MFKIITQLLFATILLPTAIFAQVTTGSISGNVKDENGTGLIGATIEAIHEPTGTSYKTVAGADGRIAIPAMRVGGPYKIKITYVGFKTEEHTDVYIQLGEPTRIESVLTSEDQLLVEVVVIGQRKGSLISKDRKGTSTNINRRVLSTVPTLSRSIEDFIRLTPQARGTSFAGQDSRAINLTIDGSIFNNSFGLAALPGGQTNATPISLDAIEEIQVNISPYSLKDAGFTGASINVVTKGGTNTLRGTAFYNQRNQSYVGKTAIKTPVVIANFDVKQFGASFGGPIVKNKAFYFLSYESERRTDPGTGFVASDGTNTGGNVTRVKKTDLDALSTFLKTKLNYDPGVYQDFSSITKSDKALARFDFNIGDNNKVSVRGNILKSQRDIPMSQSGGFSGRRDNLFAMAFSNSYYGIHNDIYSGIAEWNHTFNNRISNQMIFGYTANRDYRTEKGTPFPTVDILEGGRNYIAFGSEPFTPNNKLNTDTWQFSNNITAYKNKHTISAGVNFESFKFFNQFTPNITGQYVFHNLDSFYASANAFLANPNMTGNPVTVRRYNLTYSNMPGGVLWNAVTKSYSIGAYIQDEVTLDNNLNLTYGVRFDVPFFGSTGDVNKEVDDMTFVDAKGQPYKTSTSKLPSAKLMISPRIGFNYDVFGNRQTQIRGGIGLFSGRPPFVFISNQISNNGVQSGSIFIDNTKAYPFSPNVTRNIPTNIVPGTPAPTYNIATTDQNFRFQQVIRTNMAVDQQLGRGIVLTGEFLFTQNLSAAHYINANLRPATTTFAGPDNRPRFAGVGLGGIALNNAIRVNPKITNAIVLQSKPYGQSLMTTVKIEKQARAKGLGWLVAYNFGRTTDFMSAGSIAFSSWRDLISLRGNNDPDIAFSSNDLRHRVLYNINWRQEFTKDVVLILTLVGESSSQGRYSYVYTGDMNGDGIAGNDLMYIPRDQSEMNFLQYTANNITYTVQQQRDAFDAYINQDKYLSKRRGMYAERNGGLRPMLTTFDASAILEIGRKIGKQKHSIQLRADIFNVGSLLNSKWGVADINNNTALLDARGVNAAGVPVFRMNALNDKLDYTTYRKGSFIADVWQAQFGIRYSF